VHFSGKWELGWLLILGALFTYEAYAVFARNPYRPTLTKLTITVIPPEITLTFICWLFLHFAIHYYRRGL